MSSRSPSEIYGPGIWILIHYKSLKTNTQQEKEEFKKFIEDIKNMFPCENCVKHLETFCKIHPFENYEGVVNREGTDLGLFQWAWTLHNSVNIRLGKKRVDFDTAYSMFKNKSLTCHSKCDI